VRRAIVHIGTPRTATSALQFFLARRRRALAEVGILYPELAPAAGAEPRGNHKALGEALDGRRPRRERAALFAALDEALATTTADTVILSYEGLCQIGWPRRPWRALGDAFASRGFAMEILLTVKPPKIVAPSPKPLLTVPTSNAVKPRPLMMNAVDSDSAIASPSL